MFRIIRDPLYKVPRISSPHSTFYYSHMEGITLQYYKHIWTGELGRNGDLKNIGKTVIQSLGVLSIRWVDFD